MDEVDNPLVGIISPKTVSIGEEFLARIFLKRSDLKLIDAFIDCDSVTRPSVDTTNYDVSGCRKGLVVKDDTIRIGFRPTSPGIKKIEGITILTRDSNRVFKIIKYSFTYTTHASMYFDNNVVGIWTNGSGPNASFSITEDSIYYVEHSTSIKYEQAGDSIVFFFDENIIVRSKAYRIDKDTLIIESSQGRAKYWKFTD
ncbi:MAG: hypothetical protein WDO14_09235 [Bacteroidota bacterium]